MLTDRVFMHTKIFDRLWESLGCSDVDLQELQKAICDNPQGHPVIRGAGGVRKIQISLEGRGKSSGARVIWGFSEAWDCILICIISKERKRRHN